MYAEPEYSPWGEVKSCEILTQGVFFVTAKHHGGIMVFRPETRNLSAAARECGFWDGPYLCYEKDSHACVVYRELLDREERVTPSWVQNVRDFEKMVDETLKRYDPGYWQDRQNSRRIEPRPRYHRPQHRHRHSHSLPVR